MKRILPYLSNFLIVLGASILLATAALYGYSQYEEAQAVRLAERIMPTTVDVSDTPEPTALGPSPTATEAPEVLAAGSELNERPPMVPYQDRRVVNPTVVVQPTASPTPVTISPVLRIQATRIRLDAPVTESPIVNGEWQVPKFAAGHLQGTDQPLQGGNVVLAGHVESISSGNVFANIAKLRKGDTIKLYTKTAVISYKVRSVESVKNNDMAVVAPTKTEVLTLITCTGTWLPLQHDYNERTVVIADRVS